MANTLITEIFKNKRIALELVTYIRTNIKTIDVKTIINAELVIQLGAILSFLEDEYNIGIHATIHSYVIYYVNILKPDAVSFIRTNKDYYIFEQYDDISEIKNSLFDNYEEAIIRIFKHLETPF